MSEFKCKVCQKELKSKRTLAAHEKRHEQGDNEKTSTTATASTSREYLHCDKCPKKYLTERGLKSHQRLVHANTEVENSRTVIVATSGNISTSSSPTQEPGEELCDVPDEDEIFNINIPSSDKEPTYFIEEDDEAEEALRNTSLEGKQSKAPKPSKKSKEAWITCPTCGTKFQTIDTYVKHKETHALTDLYKKAPSDKCIQSKSAEIVRQVLQEMGKSRLTVGFASEVTNAAKMLGEKLMSEEWGIIIKRIVSGLTSCFKFCDKYLTPSDLRAAFLSSSTKFLVNQGERKEIIELLKKLIDISPGAVNIFLGTFVRIFSTHLLTYLIHFMLNGGEDVSDIPLSAKFCVTTQRTDTDDFKQVLHFIGGANVKSVLRTASRIKNPNCEWTRVIHTIKKYFIVGEDGATPPDDKLMEWTLDQDRGGLIKIGGALLDFYVELGVTVNGLEHMDGSLYQSEVITAVTNSGKLIRLWDECVKGSLPDDESFKLLHALCSHFCVTWRKGIITRRLDELATKGGTVGGNKHGKSGVAFRAAL